LAKLRAAKASPPCRPASLMPCSKFTVKVWPSAEAKLLSKMVCQLAFDQGLNAGLHGEVGSQATRAARGDGTCWQ
jgi:hypothetical protein